MIFDSKTHIAEPLLRNHPKEDVRRGVIFGSVGLLVFFSPYLYLWEDSVWSTNDYLDLVIAWYKVLVDQNAIFYPNDWIVKGLVDELPRGVLASEFYLKTWLFYFLDPFTAIIVNKLFIHFVAFFSMYHFLIEYTGDKVRISVLWIYALIWSTFSFWPEAGIAVAALPTIYFLFYQLYLGYKFRLTYFSLIFFYTAYTLLHLQGIFVGVGLFIFGVYQIIDRKKFNVNYWLGFLTFTFLSCCFNYRHFLIFFINPGDFVPHRLEYDIYSFSGFYEEFWPNFLNILLYGQLHSMRFSPFLFPFTVIILLFWKFKNSKSDGIDLSFAFKMVFVYAGFTAMAILGRYIPVFELFKFSWMKVFSYDRFLVLFLPVIFISFVLAVDYLKKVHPIGKTIQIFIIASILFFSVFVLDDNHKNVFLKPISGLGERVPTFREFYAEKQFEEIKSVIKSSLFPNGKVVSIGFHPSVSTFNGLHSLDGYTGNYPLSYKHRFSKIILPEILKEGENSMLYKHFMGWGNKCYMFNKEHQDIFLRTKWQIPQALDQPSYDWNQLKKMGGRFVLSTDPILNTPELNLLKIFDHHDSAWKIHLYEVF